MNQLVFNNIITKTPARSMINGITSAPELGKPIYEKAINQHNSYQKILKDLGLSVDNDEANEHFPDSCFVEDATVIIPNCCAVITNPGAVSRNQEIIDIEKIVGKYFNQENINLFRVVFPGTLDGGDVMMVGDDYYIGESERTNLEGIKQFTAIAAKFNKKTIVVKMDKGLHLKSGVNYLEINPKTNKPCFLINSDFYNHELFDLQKYEVIRVEDDEKYGANCIWINGSVIVPDNHPKVANQIKNLGYNVILCDTSEFKKLDGGLSCLSLRF